MSYVMCKRHYPRWQLSVWHCPGCPDIRPDRWKKLPG